MFNFMFMPIYETTETSLNIDKTVYTLYCFFLNQMSTDLTGVHHTRQIKLFNDIHPLN